MCVLSYVQWTRALQAPLCMGFFRQEYWSGLPCPTPGALTSRKVEDGAPVSYISLTDSLPLVPPGKPTSPPQRKDIFKVLTLSTSEPDLIWKTGFCRFNQVNIRSLDWALI